MRLAKDKNSDILQVPTPNKQALCPSCKDTVISKCGEINVWHWSHKANDCDSWHEPETHWHRQWKEHFPLNQQEVVFGMHRADINVHGTTILLQNNYISPAEIRERETYYKDVVWVFKADEFFDNIKLKDRKDYYSFRWKHPRKHIWYATKPVFLDFNDGIMLYLGKVYKKIPCGGWGYTL